MRNMLFASGLGQTATSACGWLNMAAATAGLRAAMRSCAPGGAAAHSKCMERAENTGTTTG